MSITRSRIMVRARYGWPQGTVPFDRTALHQPDGYRQDAAGYVSMCWDIPLDAPHSWGGMTTLTLDSDGWAIEIPPIELKPGDALGYLGPGSVGPDGGVAVIFESWLNDDYMTNYLMCWEQLPEGSPGPIRRARPFHGPTWHCYRRRDVED